MQLAAGNYDQGKLFPVPVRCAGGMVCEIGLIGTERLSFADSYIHVPWQNAIQHHELEARSRRRRPRLEVEGWELTEQMRVRKSFADDTSRVSKGDIPELLHTSSAPKANHQRCNSLQLTMQVESLVPLRTPNLGTFPHATHPRGRSTTPDAELAGPFRHIQLPHLHCRFVLGSI